MDEVSVVISGGGNGSEGSWWGRLDDDDASSLPLDASEGGLFAGNFVPPPPRPVFLDESATPDGLTTCDLCSWAWQNGNIYTMDNSIETRGEIGWVLTLVIVSLISALIGAIIMITVLHCKRLKNSGLSGNTNGPPASNTDPRTRPPISPPTDKEISTIAPATFPNVHNLNATNGGVWSWLARRSSSGPSQLDGPPCSPAENHYTHMEDSYNCPGEALYAELDRESTVDRDSNSPAYQNSAYTDPDAHVSSAPSSAYYSDLSITTVPEKERAYEVVGLVNMPNWEGERRPAIRLAAISENAATVPSDYV